MSKPRRECTITITDLVEEGYMEQKDISNSFEVVYEAKLCDSNMTPIAGEVQSDVGMVLSALEAAAALTITESTPDDQTQIMLAAMFCRKLVTHVAGDKVKILEASGPEALAEMMKEVTEEDAKRGDGSVVSDIIDKMERKTREERGLGAAAAPKKGDVEEDLLSGLSEEQRRNLIMFPDRKTTKH